MFAFGFVATAVLWLYWELHTRPFRPLQDAIAARFVDSNPRVQGGQRKMHKQTPRLLEIVMRVPFDPKRDIAAAQQTVDVVLGLARRHVADLEAYERLEVHLFQPVPESDPRIELVTRELNGSLGDRSR
ncbi:MAG: hypothetical protein KY476_04750 [Planctomycetes bacterium]|nr:hypothetical protein [Planctomycetota bacterium]